MIGEACIHSDVQWRQSFKTVMVASSGQALRGSCDTSSLVCSHDSSSGKSYHFSYKWNLWTTWFPWALSQISNTASRFSNTASRLHALGRRWQDLCGCALLHYNLRSDWPASVLFCLTPSRGTTLSTMFSQCLLMLLRYCHHIMLLVITPFVSLTRSWAPPGQGCL